MTRTDVTTRGSAAAAPAQPGVLTTKAWLRPPSAAPGVLRVRPLTGEATASYTQRLANAYRLALPQLLDGIGITLHRHGTLPAAELHLNHNAAQHLAGLTRIPLPHLTRALSHLALRGDAHHTEAAARWKRLEAEQQPVRACTLCTRHRSRSATDTTWAYRPPHRLMCPRHHQTAPDPRLTTTIHTWAAPELAAAHHAHQRLLRHPRTTTTWTTARAITTRWHDHQHHLTHRWHTRLHQLCATNPQQRLPHAPRTRPGDLPGNRHPRRPSEPATPRHRQNPQPHRPPTRAPTPAPQRQRSPPRLPHPPTKMNPQAHREHSRL
ncbi:TniQ family protein [Streptomyces zagrosensis]|uniref:TniQ protein n=1 Tax=Streptomyces zagrosensis TaxID=1042984 RepID=A0A7W9V1I6_9ACTN|nr:TniQ family protein [Streptomyces zagrosensis]MBB5938957.1 hypothetical protein [Streptomyces zagrosensis]